MLSSGGGRDKLLKEKLKKKQLHNEFTQSHVSSQIFHTEAGDELNTEIGPNPTPGGILSMVKKGLWGSLGMQRSKILSSEKMWEIF